MKVYEILEATKGILVSGKKQKRFLIILVLFLEIKKMIFVSLVKIVDK